MVRAGSAAGAAVGALFLIHNGNTVFNVDGVELTGSHAGAEAEAAVLAGLGVAAADLGGGQTVLHAAILEVILGVAAAVAQHVSHHLIAGGSLHAHDSRDLGGILRTGGRAGGDGSLTGQNGLGAAAAAGIAAAAAVGAGQTCLDLRQTGVYLDLEHLGGHRQDQAEDNGKSTQNNDCPNNSHIPLPPYQTFRPLKPMKASAIRPAVTSAMGKPSKALGFSLETSSCSRTAANRKMASRKPRPPVMP